jgi:molybdenum cofactor biosynthesis enzyme MoaA
LAGKCNLTCSYCFNEGYLEQKANESHELIESVLSKHINLGGLGACITGGEPLLSPFFEKTFNLIQELYNNRIHLTTNGTIVKKSHMNILKQIERINVSIPCFNEIKYKKITGKDLFRKLLHNIDCLIRNGCKLNLNYCLIPGVNDSHEELNKLINFAQERNLLLSILKLYNTNIKVPKEQYFDNLRQTLKSHCENSEVAINRHCPPVSIYKLNEIDVIVRDFYFDTHFCQHCTDCEHINECEEGLCQPRTNEEGNIKTCLLKNDLNNYSSNLSQNTKLTEMKEIYLTANSRWIRYQ